MFVGDDLDTFRFWRRLDQHGIFANPVVPPATPPGKGLIRTSYMATHEDRDIDDVLEVFALLAAERQAVTGGWLQPTLTT